MEMNWMNEWGEWIMKAEEANGLHSDVHCHCVYDLIYLWWAHHITNVSAQHFSLLSNVIIEKFFFYFFEFVNSVDWVFNSL